MSQLKIGIYGRNGHQIHHIARKTPNLELVAVAGCKAKDINLEEPFPVEYESLKDLLADENVEMVSLCSPIRRKQAQEAIQCLEAGKHVYAEKPCAMTEKELDEIISTAQKTGKIFHEMAGTAFDQPYWTMREIVKQGTIGTVVQVLTQKSYPLRANRPAAKGPSKAKSLQEEMKIW